MTLEMVVDPAQSSIMLAPASEGVGVVPRTKTILHSVMLPSMEEWKMLWEYARLAVATKSYEGMDSPERAMQIILKGFHLGLDPIESLQQIVYTGKKMSMQAQLMISLANRSRMLKVLEIPDPKDALKAGQATVRIVRLDRPDEYIGTFSMKDAETAGLATKPIWKLYPGAMLVNRAVSLTLRRGIPEVLGGLYLAEELEDDDRSRPTVSASATSKPSKQQLPASVASPAPSKDETVIESAPPVLWWETADLGVLVDKAIKAGYIESGQGAADLLKIIREDNWKTFATRGEAGQAIKAAVDKLTAPSQPTQQPFVPQIVPPVTVTSIEPTPEPSLPAPVVDETIYEVTLTQASYNGRTITFDTLRDGKIIIWSREELADLLALGTEEQVMLGKGFAEKWQVKSWAGTAETPGRYTFDALILGYKKAGKGLKLVSARVDEIPF